MTFCEDKIQHYNRFILCVILELVRIPCLSLSRQQNTTRKSPFRADQETKFWPRTSWKSRLMHVTCHTQYKRNRDRSQIPADIPQSCVVQHTNKWKRSCCGCDDNIYGLTIRCFGRKVRQGILILLTGTAILA